MKSKTFLSDMVWGLALVVLLGVTVGTSRQAKASVINVNNAGFEDFVLSDGQFTRNLSNGAATEIVSSDPIPGWVVNPLNVSAGSINLLEAELPGGVPEGENVAFLAQITEISQVLSDVLLPEVPYQLQVEVGRRPLSFLNLMPYAIQLFAGGNLLAQDNNGLSPALGEFEESTIDFMASAGDFRLGLPLEIRIKALSGQVGQAQTLFDDVRLTTAPEPSSLALFGVASAMLLRRRRSV